VRAYVCACMVLVLVVVVVGGQQPNVQREYGQRYHKATTYFFNIHRYSYTHGENREWGP